MNYELTRGALFALLKTGWEAGAYAGTPIEWENFTMIDHNTRTAPFLTVDIAWHDAEQASLEENPLKRTHAELLIHIHVKDGDGTRLGLQMADVLDGILKFKTASGVRLHAPRLMKPVGVKGWHIWPFSTSFHFTQ